MTNYTLTDPLHDPLTQYIEKFFPASSNYNKLAIHFTIDSLSHAERSVDARMTKEILKGKEVIQRGGDSVKPIDIVNVNLGGPYGGSVLAGVQADSERVWSSVVEGKREGWQFATVNIIGDKDDGKWKCGSAGGVKHDFF